MNNLVYLIGRLAKDVREDGITLAVQRSYKNKDDIYETDMIECTFDGQPNIAKNTQEYCKKGDLVGIKGSLRQGGIVAIEKISFLASKRK